MPDPFKSVVWERWCGICFAWNEQHEGRCVACGNAHMTGGRVPRLVPDADALPSEREK